MSVEQPHDETESPQGSSTDYQALYNSTRGHREADPVRAEALGHAGKQATEYAHLADNTANKLKSRIAEINDELPPSVQDDVTRQHVVDGQDLAQEFSEASTGQLAIAEQQMMEAGAEFDVAREAKRVVDPNVARQSAKAEDLARSTVALGNVKQWSRDEATQQEGRATSEHGKQLLQQQALETPRLIADPYEQNIDIARAATGYQISEAHGDNKADDFRRQSESQKQQQDAL